jgi:hypothetical protein
MNTSTVIPASRRRPRKGNPVVSYETVIYGYESPATLTTDRFYRPVLSSQRVPQDEQQTNFPAKERKKYNLVMGPKGVPDTKTY